MYCDDWADLSVAASLNLVLCFEDFLGGLFSSSLDEAESFRLVSVHLDYYEPANLPIVGMSKESRSLAGSVAVGDMLL